MFNIHIVGLGSLGSTFASEVAKRSLALEFPLQIHLYDFDTVEERNVVAQNFRPTDIGEKKVNVVGRELRAYEDLEVFPYVEKVTKDNWEGMMKLNDQSIIVDAVDNVPTRWLLWEIGLYHVHPVLHMGMATTGSGLVSWNFRDTDTFNLSPGKLSPAKKKELMEREEDKKMAPCMLNSFRPLIFNTSMAGVIALFNFLGRDSADDFRELHDGKPFAGLMTTWNITPTSFNFIRELTMIQDF